MFGGWRSTDCDEERAAANELVGGERHQLRPIGTAAAILIATGDAGFVEPG